MTFILLAHENIVVVAKLWNVLGSSRLLDVGCITDHEDFSPLTNKTVLLEVAPLLRNKDGKRYRRQPGNTENQ